MFRFTSVFVLFFCILFVTDGLLFYKKKSPEPIPEENDSRETEDETGESVESLERHDSGRSSGRSDESFVRSNSVRSSGRSGEFFERSDSGRSSGKSDLSSKSNGDVGRSSKKNLKLIPSFRRNRVSPELSSPSSYSAEDEFMMIKNPRGGKLKKL